MIDGDRAVQYRFELQPVAASVPVAGAAVAEVAAQQGLVASTTTQLRCLVEEIVGQALHRIGEEEPDPITVTLERQGTLLHAAISDKGLPSEHAPLPPLASALVELGFAESVRTGYNGRDGNVVELDVALPEHHAIVSGEEQLPEDAPTVDTDSLDIRVATPDDAAAIARCIYRTYGYSYPGGFLYFPERLAAKIAAGEMHSFVAVNPDGEVVAHVGYKSFGSSGRACFQGYAVTDPRYRGRGLMGKVGRLQEDEQRENGVIVAASTPVTTHRVTQEAALHSGARELGVVLAWHMPVKQIGFTDGVTSQRSTAVFYARLRGELPHRTLHVPSDYLDFVRRVVDHNELPRTIEVARPRAATDAPATSRLSIDVDGENRLATITVEEAGRDLLDAVSAHLADLSRATDVVHLDLPLGDPASGALAAGLHELGFVYSALCLELVDSGDALRLQHLAGVEIDASQFDIASDFTRQLIDDVIADLESMTVREDRYRRRRAQMGRLLSALDSGERAPTRNA